MNLRGRRTHHRTAQASQRAEGLGGANCMIRVLGLRENLDHRLQNLAHVLTHVFQLVGRGHAGRQKFSGDAARASRGGKRYGRLFVGAHRHFERTAADVQHQQSAGIPTIPTAGGPGRSGEPHPCQTAQ